MKVLKSRPKDWHITLALASVPHDGSVYEENFSFSLPSPVLYYGQEYSLTAPLAVLLEATRNGESIVASVTVSSSVTAPCSRCLESARSEISSTLRWVFSTKDEEQEGEWKYDEHVKLDSLEEHVSFEDYVWETFITALPVTLLCSDDCRGLCPTCGVNLNKQSCNCHEGETDPRLEILKNLL